PAALCRAGHRGAGAVAARRGRQSARLSANAGRSRHPFLRSAVRPRLCLADEPRRRKRDDRRTQAVARRLVRFQPMRRRSLRYSFDFENNTLRNSINTGLQFPVDAIRAGTYRLDMNPVIKFVQLENRVISAIYRNLMVRAKVLVVDKNSGQPLPDPVTTIASPVPSGSLGRRPPTPYKPGAYFLKALNGHGEDAAQSAEFQVT